MQTYLKTKPVWIQLLLFLGMAMGSFVIASSVALMILTGMTGLSPAELQASESWDLTNPAYRTYLRGMILVQFLFLFVIPSLLFARFSDPKPGQYLGLKAPHNGIYWVYGILLIVVAYPFVEYIAFLNQKLPLDDDTATWMRQMEDEAARQIKYMLQERTPLELAKNLVFIAVFAGVGEELFFRGILQRMFIRVTRNPWVGIIITAAIFSAIHFQFYGFFPRLFLGVLLGAIYWFSGSLWVAILAHFFYDAAVVLLVYFNPHMLENAEATLIQGKDLQLLVGAMISLALTFVILSRMQKQSVTSFEEVYNDDFPKPNDNLSF